MKENEKRMLLDVDEFPQRKSQALILAIQHVLAMFVACITVPTIVFQNYVTAEGTPLTQALLAPTIVAAGVGTLFYLAHDQIQGADVSGLQFRLYVADDLRHRPWAHGVWG
jgi:xanthine/uracil permease